MSDIVIVNAGMYCWGTDRTQLFEALRRLGWHQQGDDLWRAPEQSVSIDTMAAARSLYLAAPPVAGLDLERCSEQMAAFPDSDYWRQELGPYQELRAAPEFGRGVWVLSS